jgi:hypothetical protein
MEHVSLARHAYKVSMIQDADKLWASYWSGVGTIVLELPVAGHERKSYESGVIWEYLVDGAVQE